MSLVVQCLRQLIFIYVLAMFGTVWTVPLAFSAVTSETQLNRYQGRTISKVLVKGLQRIETEAVLGKIQSKEGSRLDRATIAKDIKAVYKMGYFQEIDVQATNVGAGGVNLLFEIRERPVMSKVVFEGNEQIGTGDLLGVIRTKEWAILDVNRLREDTERIQKYYEDRGFYLAKVDFDVVQVKEDEVHVTFKINDFDKVQIRKVTFLNNRVFSDKRLKSVLAETQEGSFFSFLSGAGSFKESSFKRDLQLLTYYYLDNGYVKFRYESPSVTISDDKRSLFISIFVEEGLSYKVGKIDFSGDLLFPKSELYESLVMTEGETFRISQRNLDIQTLTEKYQDLGYAFVNVIPKMTINDEDRTVDINYTFEKGNLVYFREIRVVGNTKTHDKVVRRELRIYEGELFSGSGLRISRERVERLGYFQPNEVIFNTLTVKGRDDLVDIEIRVKERSTGTITLGAGYGSVQKFFLTTQIQEINLFGRGQTLSFQAQYSAQSTSQSFNLGFTEPYFLDTKWSLGGDIFFVNFPIPDRYTALRKLGFDIRLGYPITDEINAFITYKNEGIRLPTDDDGVPLKVYQEIDETPDIGVLSSIVWSLVRDKRNNRFEPTRGNYQNLSLETAGIGGDFKFIKWKFNNRFYTPIIGDLIFRTSFEYGQVTSLRSDGEIPTTERFLLGGPNNMKGFRVFSLGPKETITLSDGTQVDIPKGGTVELFSLFEIEYPLIREAGLKWVMFYDIGNAFAAFPGTEDETGTTVPFELRQDAGFGFRWFSPIGPLRFEWGFPIGRKAGESNSEFQFFIGPPF